MEIDEGDNIVLGAVLDSGAGALEIDELCTAHPEKGSMKVSKIEMIKMYPFFIVTFLDLLMSKREPKILQNIYLYLNQLTYLHL